MQSASTVESRRQIVPARSFSLFVLQFVDLVTSDRVTNKQRHKFPIETLNPFDIFNQSTHRYDDR
jgi:hypothetical protein